MVSAHTRKVLANPPEHFDGHGFPSGTRNNLEINVFSDDTTTTAFMVLDGVQVAHGVSRRRPGEKRNARLGHSVALARMFAEAAQRYADDAHSIMNPQRQKKHHSSMEKELRVLEELARKLGLTGTLEDDWRGSVTEDAHRGDGGLL